MFFGIGFALDRWLGTTPWFMIVFMVLGGVGFFAKMKYHYDAQMDAARGRAPGASCAGRVGEGATE